MSHHSLVRRRRLLFSLMLALAGLATLTLGELGVRAICYRDLDGNRWIGWRRLKPYRSPARTL
jgi:hypothetical protein